MSTHTILVPEGFEIADIKVQFKPSKTKVDVKVKNRQCISCPKALATDSDLDQCTTCIVRNIRRLTDVLPSEY